MQLFTSLHESTPGDSDAGQVFVPIVACGCPLCAGAGGNLQQPAGGAGGTLPGTPLSSNTAGSPGDAAALASGSQWDTRDASGKTVITYSFASAWSAFGEEEAQFSATATEFSAQDKATTRALLATIASVCNVTFVEVADNGPDSSQVRYAYSQAPNNMGFAGYAFFPSSGTPGGDVWIGTNQTTAQWDFYRPDLILHETLHAIGLKHPFDGGVTLDTQTNIIPNTVMSYSPVAGTSSGSLAQYPAEPMPLDVLELQNLYGAAAHNSGDTVYNMADGFYRSNFHALWDSDGNDTLDASAVGSAVTLDLHAGARSDIGVRISSYALFNGTPSYGSYTSTLAIAGSAQVENAVGSNYGDTLIGNDLDNVLTGRGGDDRIDGGWGTDTAVYAGSIANFRIEKLGDVVYVTDRQNGQGTDVLTGVEKLRFQDLSVDLTVQDAAAAASDARLHAAVELYVGFFNRVPDAEGLNFWLNQMNQGMTTSQMADAFYTAAQQFSSLTGYSASMTNEDFVRVIYSNVLGRSEVDAGGLAFWSNALASGAASRGALLDSILGSAHTFAGDAQYGWVADLLDNKYEVGKVFAVDMGLSFNTSAESITRGMEIAAAVTPTDTHAALELIGVAAPDLALAG